MLTLGLRGVFLESLDIFDIGASEDDELESLVRWGNEACDWSVFGAVRYDIFQGNSLFFWIYLVQFANISGAVSKAMGSRLNLRTGFRSCW